MTEFLFSWIAVGAVITGIIMAEQRECRWAVLLLSLLSFVQLVNMVNISASSLVVIAAVYMPIGIVFSILRYNSYVAAVVRRTKYLKDEYEKDRTMEKLHPTAMLFTIVVWILTWPFVLVSSIVSDIIAAAKYIFAITIKKLYYKIYYAALKDVKSKSGKGSGD